MILVQLYAITVYKLYFHNDYGSDLFFIESSQPAGTIQGEMVFLGPLCTTSYREILSQNFVNSMNQWNMEFEMCPGNVCNFSNITVECVTSVRRRRRSTKGTYLVIFDIPVNG